MPLESKWEGRSLYRRFHGQVEAEEILTSNDAIYGDPRFDDLRCLYADFVDADDVRIDTQQLKRLAALDDAASRTNPRVKLAITVVADHLIELANVYKVQSARGGWTVEVFSDRADAEAWMRA